MNSTLKRIKVHQLRIFTTLLVLMVFSTPLPAFSGDPPLIIYTVNYPLKYFAERVGEKYVKVYFPAPSDVDPAFWVPDITTISEYQKADLILLNGAGYAKWIEKVSLPRSKLIDTSRTFKERFIPIEGVVTHSHGPEGKHVHGEVAFTTWLDFSLAVEQARTVTLAIGRKRSAVKETFDHNFMELEKELLALDNRLKQMVGTSPGMPLTASHPVYDYLARRYELNLKSLHLEPDEVPDAGQLTELQQLLETHATKWMIWEGTPLLQSVNRLKELGLRSLVFSPCANAPPKGNFMSIMSENLTQLERAFD